MLIVNLFAGPGAGKSTTAAATFSMLKMASVNCELVTEFAKDLTWDRALDPLSYAPYVFGQQAWRIQRLRGKVDVVITDSPLLLSLVYAKDTGPAGWSSVVLAEAARDQTLNFFLRRVKQYNPTGRNQSAEEARALDDVIKTTLSAYDIPHEDLTADGTAPVVCFGRIMQKLTSN